jgi:CopA family copper-resistance protein
MTVVAADGQDIEPVTVDEFRIGAAEVYDVIVTPSDDRAYTIFAQAMDRSGYARGTLAPRAGMQAEVPAMDPRPLLTMADMGMSHGGHDMAGMDHAAMGGMPGMDHGGTDHSAMDHSGMDHAAMDHSHHASESSAPAATAAPASASATNDAAMSGSLTHPASESSPNVDMQVAQASPRLNDPGVGLRDNGRKVLTYADLHTLGGPIDRRAPGREIQLHLTGHMERFIWSFNGQKFSQAEPLRFAHGERLRIVLINDSMMNHPIHLHGMWSELEDESGAFLVRKHTVTVQPAQRMSYLVTADALGRWAYHCHLLYHMEAGMFREVVVAHDTGSSEHHS